MMLCLVHSTEARGLAYSKGLCLKASIRVRPTLRLSAPMIQPSSGVDSILNTQHPLILEREYFERTFFGRLEPLNYTCTTG